MKRRSLLITLTFSLFASVFGVSAQDIVVIGGAKYTVHDVAKGETLYSLARQYGVKVEDIVSANAELSDGLKAGQRIKIPVNGAIETPQQATDKGETQIVHKVIKGETLYSLSQRYGVSIEDIYASNGHIKRGLKAGMLIAIPSKEASLQTLGKKDVETTSQTVGVAEGRSVVAETVKSASEHLPVGEFPLLEKHKRANVALLLPLGSVDKPSSNYLDFYRGFMMGLDSVRSAGLSADVVLHNTAHDHNRLDRIIASRELEQADLIVGPIYEDELIPVVASLEGKNKPVVSPLANLTTVANGNIFQMSPAPSTKYDKVRSMFDGSKRVVIISTDNVDKAFDTEVRSMLKDTSYVVEHKYIYEHPSIIEKREKEREKMREEGLEVDDTPSPSDMSPLLKSDKETVFVITANNEIEVDRILAAIASANIALTARSQRVAPYVVFGNNRWNRFRNIDRAILFANRVTMLSTYHARRSDMRIRNFDRRFVEEFGSLPSLYAYRGYDTAVLFVSALYKQADRYTAMPLLTPYAFERDERGVNVNNHWIKVNYNNNFTITTE